MMSIVALALYGSYARGENDIYSDVDLFAITDDDRYEMLVNGNTNIACYPKELAFNRAEMGDLFLLHVCKEAKDIYSPFGDMQKLKNSFRYKDSYQEEIHTASDLGWFLVDLQDKIKNHAAFNKRVAWCVRTILIAKSAEIQSPVFSALELSKLSGDDKNLTLIKRKGSEEYCSDTSSILKEFLLKHGAAKPYISDSCVYLGYLKFFKKNKNIMGMKTIFSLEGDAVIESYN